MSKEKQIEEMAKVIEHRCNRDCIPSCDECIAQTLYTAGYRKQSEGEWIDNDDMYTADMLNYRCSLCGCYEYTKTSFCPNCGAKMKGGETDA